MTEQKAKTEKSPTTPEAPKRRWQIWAETEDRQHFGCGVYEAETQEQAIELGEKRAKDQKYSDSIKIKKFIAEETTEPVTPPAA